jgi:hypothetical protein
MARTATVRYMSTGSEILSPYNAQNVLSPLSLVNPVLESAVTLRDHEQFYPRQPRTGGDHEHE